MSDNSVILYLFVATFVIVLVYGFVQLYKVRKAKREHTRSAISAREHGPDTVKSGGNPTKR